VLAPTRHPTDHPALAALAAKLRGEEVSEAQTEELVLPSTEAVEARWDEFAERFVSHFEPNTLRAAHAAMDQLCLEGARRVLEVGCGGGGAGVELAARLDEGAELTLTDISGEMVKLAQKRVDERGLTGVRVCKADAQALPFETASFDRLFSCLNLMLVPDPVAALSEAARVLEPGGLGVWVVWGRPEHSPMMTLLPEAAKRVGLALPPTPRSNFHLGGLDRLREMLTEVGFERTRLWSHQMASTIETGEAFAELIINDRPELKRLLEGEAQEKALKEALAELAQARLDGGEPLGLDTLIAVARRA
jgi:ubiquinone/menaquinone biosynthesis C-methylase UbiE